MKALGYAGINDFYKEVVALDKAIFTVDTLNPGLVEIETTETIKGIKSISKKTVSYEDFLTIVNESLTTDKIIKIGKLPAGFYDGVIDSDQMGFACLIVVPGGIKPLNYYDQTFMVPYPSLIFILKVRMGVLKKSKVFALTSDNVSDKTQLYHFPYGNVYENGEICWGQNVIKGIKKLRDTERIISTFFGCETNDDLWDNGKYVNAPVGDPCKIQRGLLEYLNGKEKFPTTMLTKADAIVGKSLFKEECT